MTENKQKRTIKIWHLFQYHWDEWTRPSLTIHVEEECRRAKLTASVILLMFPISIIYLLTLLFLEPVEIDTATLLSVGILLFTMAVMYIISRTQHYAIASIFIVTALSIYPFLTIAFHQEFQIIAIYNTMMWSLVAILVGSILLPLKQAGIQIVIILGLILLVPTFHGDISYVIIIQPFTIIAVLALLILLFQKNLQNLEKRRFEKENLLYLEVKKSEEQFRILFEQAPIGMSITAPDGRFINVNSAYCQTVGYSTEELQSMTFQDISHSDDIEKNLTLKEKLLKKEILNFTIEKRYIHKDGHTIDVLIKASLEETDKNDAPRVLAQIIDISEQKDVENKLRENQQLLQGITENSTAIIFVKGLDGRYLLVNKAFENAYAQNRTNIIGKTDFDLFPIATAISLRDADEAVLQKGDSVQLEEHTARTSEHRTTYLTIKFPLHDQNGNVYAITGIATDITERKIVETQLRQQKGQLEALRQVGLEITAELEIEALLKSIIIHAVNILETDSGALWLYVPEQKVLKLMTNHNSSFPVGMYLQEGEGITGQVWKSGRPKYISNYKEWEDKLNSINEDKLAASVIAVPILGKNQVIGVIAVASTADRAFTQDEIHLLELFAAQAAVAITNARLHEQRKQHSNELERSNKELQDFAYAASHDLQEPLRKIQAFSDRLQVKYGQTLDERGMDYLLRMGNAASRMQTLIVDLLTYSRVTTQAQPFMELNLTDIVESVRQALELLVEESQTTIIVQPLPTIEADQMQMVQLFQNLISNAIKFMKTDRLPLIEITAVTNADSVTISVTDNGIGFEEKYAERIFGVFQRLHGREKYGGTGVGLAICLKIIKRHQGTITVSSQVDRGSTFFITLPRKQAKQINKEFQSNG